MTGNQKVRNKENVNHQLRERPVSIGIDEPTGDSRNSMTEACACSPVTLTEPEETNIPVPDCTGTNCCNEFSPDTVIFGYFVFMLVLPSLSISFEFKIVTSLSDSPTLSAEGVCRFFRLDYAHVKA
jgi:hypothetical protein